MLQQIRLQKLRMWYRLINILLSRGTTVVNTSGKWLFSTTLLAIALALAAALCPCHLVGVYLRFSICQMASQLMDLILAMFELCKLLIEFAFHVALTFSFISITLTSKTSPRRSEVKSQSRWHLQSKPSMAMRLTIDLGQLEEGSEPAIKSLWE